MDFWWISNMGFQGKPWAKMGSLNIWPHWLQVIKSQSRGTAAVRRDSFPIMIVFISLSDSLKYEKKQAANEAAAEKKKEIMHGQPCKLCLNVVVCRTNGPAKKSTGRVLKMVNSSQTKVFKSSLPKYIQIMVHTCAFCTCSSWCIIFCTDVLCFLKNYYYPLQIIQQKTADPG